MEKQADTVSVKTEYPPSDIYSSEPPPAYVKGRSNAVQMARIAAYTLVACCFILGFFLLASSYVTASFSASLHKELYQEERPIYERLIDPLEAESRHISGNHEAIEVPQVQESHEARENVPELQEDSKEEIKEEPKEIKETKEDDKETENQIAIKLPIHLDMDDIAAMAGQFNCALGRRLVTPPGMDGMAVAVICSSGPREWNEGRDEPELVRHLMQQHLEESQPPQNPFSNGPQRLIFRQLLLPPPFMQHAPISSVPQMNSNSIEDSSEEGIIRLIADNVLRMLPDNRESPRAQGRAIHAPGLVHSFAHPQARGVHQMYAGRPPLEVQRMLQMLHNREEPRPEIMQVQVPVESMVQVRTAEYQRPPVEGFRPPVEQMRLMQARMMKPVFQVRPPMTEGIVQVRPEGMMQINPHNVVQVRPVTENARHNMFNQNGVVQIHPPMETMRPPMETMRPPMEGIRPHVEAIGSHMDMRTSMEQLVEMRPPVQQVPAQPRMDDFEQASVPDQPPTQQPEYLRPHLLQPRSIRSVDHPRNKRVRRFA